MEDIVVENNNKQCEKKGIMIFFLLVISVFTCINLYEFLFRTEANGRLAGLNELGTVKEQAVTFWGGIQNILGKDLAFGSTIYEDVTRLNNGYFIMADANSSYEAMLTGCEGAEALASEIGAQFLYVQAPGKQREEYLPEGVVCYSEMKRKAVVQELRLRGMDVIDMASVLEKTGEDWMSYFYITDHHWNNDAAFLAYQSICEYMRKNGTKINENYLDESNFKTILYDDIFLGTHGRMAGPWYTGLDDYELWLPDFPTSFSLAVPSEGIYKEGSFEECFVNYGNLEKYSYDYYAYYSYLQRDYDCIEIKNSNCSEGPSVVVIRDSNAVPVSVFTALQCSELVLLDLRYMKENNAMDYIRNQNPDYIIYLFGTGYLGEENVVVMR